MHSQLHSSAGALTKATLLSGLLIGSNAVCAKALSAGQAMSPQIAAHNQSVVVGRCVRDTCGYYEIERKEVWKQMGDDENVVRLTAKEWDSQHDPNIEPDEYAVPGPLSGGKRVRWFALCSKRHPATASVRTNKDGTKQLRVDTLAPGNADAVYGATEDAYSLYFYACHGIHAGAFTNVPIGKSLGYKVNRKWIENTEFADRFAQLIGALSDAEADKPPSGVGPEQALLKILPLAGKVPIRFFSQDYQSLMKIGASFNGPEADWEPTQPCQECDDFRLTNPKVVKNDGVRAVVNVARLMNGKTGTTTFYLVNEDSDWKIDDIDHHSPVETTTSGRQVGGITEKQQLRKIIGEMKKR